MANWLSWAVDDWAPPENAGYSGLNIARELTDLTLRRGLVLHSSEGYWSASYRPSDTMKARGNSWAVSIMQGGAVYRHRLRPTWVNWHAGGPAQNVGTDGIEMEGKEPWTQAQKVSLVRVLKETRAWFGWPPYAVGAITNKTQTGIQQALLARPYGSLWEHRWFDSTSCPSGRDEWTWLIPALLEPQEDEMDEAAIRRIVAEMIAASDLKNVQGQVDQLIDMHEDEGNEHHAWLLNIQGQVNQNVEMHRGPHGQTAGGLTLEEIAESLTVTGKLEIE